jgi:FkbM family methyltransferase
MNWGRSFAGRLLRRWLDRRDYVLWRRGSAPFGVFPFHDADRLLRARGGAVSLVFDVGANEGQTARVVLGQFADARVWSFEPQPKAFEALVGQISDPRFSAFQLALGSSRGVATLYDYSDGPGGSTIGSLVPDARYATQGGFSATTLEVECETLDAFCQAHGVDRIDLLKIDTEGYDLEVLRGAAGLLAAGAVRAVLVEFNDLTPKAGVTGGALGPIAEFLSPSGFSFLASYVDWVDDGGAMVVSNALFLLTSPPSSL